MTQRARSSSCRVRVCLCSDLSHMVRSQVSNLCVSGKISELDLDVDLCLHALGLLLAHGGHHDGHLLRRGLKEWNIDVRLLGQQAVQQGIEAVEVHQIDGHLSTHTSRRAEADDRAKEQHRVSDPDLHPLDSLFVFARCVCVASVVLQRTFPH